MVTSLFPSPDMANIDSVSLDVPALLSQIIRPIAPDFSALRAFSTNVQSPLSDKTIFCEMLSAFSKFEQHLSGFDISTSPSINCPSLSSLPK